MSADPLQAAGRYTRLAVDLVNTGNGARDELRAPTELRAFLLAHDEPEPIRVSAADLAAVRRLRSRLAAVFVAESESAAAGLLNALLGESCTAPYLSDHDDTAWHLHFSRTDAPWSEWLASITATGLARLLAEGGFPRLLVCAAEDCTRVLVDESRNHRQRFCSAACATRTRVAAHRRRANSV